MEKEELFSELRKKFDLAKKKLGFKASYEDINSFFYIEDTILTQKYVSDQFSRQMINRMIETYSSWINELHSWVYPNPMDMIHQNENKSLSVEERKEIMAGIDRIMYFIRKNKRIIFDEFPEKEEGKFIDELVDFSKDYFRPFMLKCHIKFEKYWEKEIQKE